MAQNSTPFWLEIKTEYIDANLDKVIEYLSKEASNSETDSFYEKTEKLLGQRVRELTGETPIPVKLELDLLAWNLLVEEYPESAAELKPIGDTAGTPTASCSRPMFTPCSASAVSTAASPATSPSSTPPASWSMPATTLTKP